MKRYFLLTALCGFLIVAGFALGLKFAHHEADTHSESHSTEAAQASEAIVSLTEQQIADAGIKTGLPRIGVLQEHFLVPGTVVPDADRIGRVAVRLLGTVAELRKRIGDEVQKGDIVAVIESRELSDAKSEYLAARITNDLQQTLTARQKNLWDSRATSENDYLRSRLSAQDAQIRLDSARQKLLALGLSAREIEELPEQSVESLRRQSLRAPIGGRVAERRVDVGGLVGREGQESELFVIVDLDRVWVDLIVPPGDVRKVSEGTEVAISAGDTKGQAKIIFVSPLIDKETRSARVVAALENPSHEWRPGTFITAEVPVPGNKKTTLVPKEALQVVDGSSVVFVRNEKGFEARKIKTGREDDEQVELVSGVEPNETIAIANTFVLKAELGKREAEHGH